MWHQTMKARQAVRGFVRTNNPGDVVGLEYSDDKVEVHLLQREASPLLLEEGSVFSVITCAGGGMYVVAVNFSAKSTIEFKAWDALSSIGFTPKEITVEDSQKNTINDGKFRGLLNVSESSGTIHSLKAAALNDYLAVTCSAAGLVFLWKCRMADHGTALNFKLVAIIRSGINLVQHITLLQLLLKENCPDVEGTQVDCPALVIGETGGIHLFTPTPTVAVSSGGGLKFVSTHIPFPLAVTSHLVQDIQRISSDSCMLSDSCGHLWYLNPPVIQEILLSGSGASSPCMFAVRPQNNKSGGWLATVNDGQTVNLYKLNEALRTVESGLIAQPWHTIFCSNSLSDISFIEDNVLAGCSASNETISLWVGLESLHRDSID